MASIFHGLGNFGLGNLESMEVVNTEEESAKKEEKKAEKPVFDEAACVYDKNYECFVCNSKFQNKTLMTGKSRLISTDADLRSKYYGVEPLKYDVISCPKCGYTATSKYFVALAPSQQKAIREKIGAHFRPQVIDKRIYSYEDAISRYRLALANAVVKNAKNSERAYTCLRAGWVVRSYVEELQEEGQDGKLLLEMQSLEEEFIRNAYDGYMMAMSKEDFPISGMDETTLNYLLAALSIRFEQLDAAAKLISNILQSRTCNARIKDKARNLKDELLEKMKQQKSE